MRCIARWWGLGLLTLGPDDVDRFLDGRRWHGRPLAARSRYKWLSTISTFFQWAIREDLTSVDPTARLDRPKLRRLLPRPWSAADAELAIAATPDQRMRCWLLLAGYAGLRCMEIAAVTREDVLDASTPAVLVAHGKGSKDRVVPLHPRVLAALHELPMPRRGHLWEHPISRRPWTAAQVSKEIAEHMTGLGLPWRAHNGRHWFGTETLNACGDLRVVQELLGHESITTTTIYTAWSKAKAAEAVAALPHPG